MFDLKKITVFLMIMLCPFWLQANSMKQPTKAKAKAQVSKKQKGVKAANHGQLIANPGGARQAAPVPPPL